MIVFGGDLEGKVREIVNRQVHASFVLNVTELDKDKMYLLIVPESVDTEALKKALNEIMGKIKLVVVQADNISLLELS